MLVGVLVAGLAAAVFLAGALMLETMLIEPGTAVAALNTLALSLAMAGASTGPVMMAALHGLWLAVLALCFAPVTIAALVGEAAGRRSLVLVAGLSGVLASAMPTFARVSGGLEAASGGPLAQRLTIILFLTGAGAGFVYWLVADRAAPV